MTAPERRRPLPALAFIGVLCLLTAVVWFRVIHRPDNSSATPSRCSTSSSAKSPKKPVTQPAPKVLPRPPTVSVLVLNSTNRGGIATATEKALVARKFRVSDAKNDSAVYGGHGLIKAVAEIRYGPSAYPAAVLLGLYFPRSVLKQTDSSGRGVIVSLGQKFHALASPAAVRKALRASHAKLGKPKPVPTPTPSPSC
jgi:hypothetical protein